MQENYPVLPGAEPFYNEGGRTGILISHGFTGTTQSMRAFGQAFIEDGYTVCGVRLAGHGTDPEDMEKSTSEDWIASVEEGLHWLRERCDTIYAAGLSMGGTLVLHLAEHHPDIQGIILINPAVEVPEMEPVLQMEEVRFLDAIGSDIKKPGVEELAYDKTPTTSIRELLPLMDRVKQHLPEVRTPALFFVSEEDHVVPPYNTDLIMEGISSKQKEKHLLGESYHVATLDHDLPFIIEKSRRFLPSVSDSVK
ncbi:alpha/beta hydrolase [Alkalicoccus urumqiensis]|uniref:Lipase n=1 Tax=Alkalicoccus urumqiensis TaxID=1548213 RepID=A0A2P6MIT1_ALKUR|nr:alpha/beta fold hydrolase [Alkalicoccus urumqiensis]PRO66178.1 lipase [Alkalicoccus urumqiensis]